VVRGKLDKEEVGLRGIIKKKSKIEQTKTEKK